MNIGEIARRAGVSRSTVSYVLSGKRTISAETRHRVERSIEELGYRPHAGARALASSRSNVLALVIPLRSGIHVPVVMQFAAAAVTAARRYDYDVLLLTQEEGNEGLRRAAASHLVDAFIVMDVQLHDPRLPLLRSLERPSVLIGVPDQVSGLTCIDLDFHAAGAACVDHLAELGHSRIGLIGSPPAVYARETGFARRTAHGSQEAARRHGITYTVHSCESTPQAARALAGRLLRDHPDLTAVVVHNEPVVQALVEAFNAAGRRVPQEMSVIALCPDELAERSSIRLTSITIPTAEVGEQAVELLMDKLEGRQVPQTTLLAPRLTWRASTAPCPTPAGHR